MRLAFQKLGYGWGCNSLEGGVRPEFAFWSGKNGADGYRDSWSKTKHTPLQGYDRGGLFLLVNSSGSKLWRWRYVLFPSG